ncbi:MAG: MMPL family transporter [Actinomycetota bacterium]|nr:MMPL family transporter [Actinomycetota bacterium]
MLSRLARCTVRRRRRVLVGAALVFALAGAIGGGVADHLSGGGFEDPGAESTEAKRVVDDVFGAGDPNLVLLVTAKSGTVDDAAVAEAGAALTEELLRAPGIDQAMSYWSLGSAPPLRGKDGTQALVIARIAGDEDTVGDHIEKLSPAFTRDTSSVSVRVGGFAEAFREIGTTIKEDLARAESVAIPVTLVLLVLVFGSVVAAGLPVGIGMLSIVGTFFVLRILAELTQVSIYALNLTTAMGLGLAIDYSLFVVSRFREELRRGAATEEAVVRTVATAGRTVVFSAATVAASLAALLVFPLSFLRSFAYAGIAVVAVAALASVLVLPAVLATLGPRIDTLSLLRRRPTEVGEGFWHRLALAVMRRPVAIGAIIVAVLLLLGSPFLHLRLGQGDDRTLPSGASSRQVQDQIRRSFPSDEAGAASVVATGTGPPAARADQIDAYAARLSDLPGVARVDALGGSFVEGGKVLPAGAMSARFASSDGTWLSVIPSVEPVSSDGERLVHAIRETPAPFAVKVTGPSAQLVDTKSSILGRLPLAAGIVALITFTLLFLMFGSVVVPLKAVVLNLLSLTATFGAMVWIFQDGHLSGLLDFTATGNIDITTPILMFCIAFGLSMDYEVFLLSRIKEEHDRTGDNQHSVAVGLERTGRIVTAAAALLGVVFLAMATSGVSFIKLFGIGLTMAVLVDATLIRATLVPAFMRLAGEANWWAPAPLRRVYRRWGIHEPMDAGQDQRGLDGHRPGTAGTAEEPSGRSRSPENA